MLNFYSVQATNRKTKRLVNRNNVKDNQLLKEIIDGCKANSRKWQAKLFELYYGKMMAVCLRYHSDRDDAQETLQQGFIKVFEKLDAYDFTGSFDGWMRRIFANTAIDAIRKNKKNPIRKDTDEDFVTETFDPMVEEEIISAISSKAELAQEAIEQLSPQYRTVFNLYVIEEYTHKEIAELLGISEGTSKSNLSKAKMNLQKVLKERYIELDK
ncbi:MAG: sigma-70 family RNA polymerase sigma factor [Bacteroidetes bacterium]|nr:sigma-70 family RNA polymerase sigma factor [Bacteroidota bacterium]